MPRSRRAASGCARATCFAHRRAECRESAPRRRPAKRGAPWPSRLPRCRRCRQGLPRVRAYVQTAGSRHNRRRRSSDGARSPGGRVARRSGIQAAGRSPAGKTIRSSGRLSGRPDLDAREPRSFDRLIRPRHGEQRHRRRRPAIGRRVHADPHSPSRRRRRRREPRRPSARRWLADAGTTTMSATEISSRASPTAQGSRHDGS